ncbi:MAG: hypothetical protein ACREPQ_00515 [Rhodanobacter sp.]
MKKLTPKQFVSSFSSQPDESRIYRRNYAWEAHCPEGILTKPNGESSFGNLEGLLSILAGVGIRRMDVEWDVLSAWKYESNQEQS